MPSVNLPTRRDEAWKWTDVGVNVTRTDAIPAANDAAMEKLATQYAGQVWDITVPEGFTSEHPIQIEGLTPSPIPI